MACWRRDNDGRRRDDCARQLQTRARRPPVGDLRARTPTHHQDDRARRSSRPTRSRRPPTRPRRSCSSSPVGGSSLDARTLEARPDLDRRRGPARDRRHVVPPDDLRLPERRRPYVVSRENLGADRVAGRRRVAARRLHPHRRGVGLRGCARDHVDPRLAVAAPTSACSLCLAAIVLITLREPARHQGVGPHLRVPHLHLHLRAHRLIGVGPRARVSPLRPACVPQHLVRRRHEGSHAAQVATRETSSGSARPVGTLGLFRSLRGFSSGAVALTGVEAISNGVPAFERPESKNAAITLVWMGVDPRRALPRRVGAGPPPAPDPARSRRVGLLPDGPHRVRQGHALLRPAGRHGRHPDPRGQHRVRRLPPPVVDHRPRRLPPAPAREPGRPPRVHQRRDRPRGRGGACSS